MSSNIKGILVEEKLIKECENPTWLLIQKQFELNSSDISQKSFELRIRKGMNAHKKIPYSNLSNQRLLIGMETNFPDILKIKTPNIDIDPEKKNYIRLKFMAPDIFCRLTVKLAIIDKTEMFIRDFLNFEIEVFN